MLLHWIVAILILGNVALGLSAAHWLPDDSVRPVIDFHKSVGITVLGLVLLRILWRASHKPPPLPRSFPGWERVLAHFAHFLLYLLMIGLPLSGWAHDSAGKTPRRIRCNCSVCSNGRASASDEPRSGGEGIAASA